MKSSSVRAQSLSAILITHLHGDHCFGLFGLLCTAASNGRSGPLLLVGPRGLRHMVVTVLSASGGFAGMPLQFLELEHETPYPDLGLIAGGVRLAAYPLKHRIASFAYVLTEGLKPGALLVNEAKRLGAEGRQLATLKEGLDVQLADGRTVRSVDCVGPPVPARRIALLQDTYDSSSALDALQGVDLLIHECTYSAALKEKAIEHGHSTSSMAGEFAAQCNAAMLVMTHFSARYDTREQTKAKQKKRAEAEARRNELRVPEAESTQTAETAARNQTESTADVSKQLQQLSVESDAASSSSAAASSSTAAVAVAASPAAVPAASLADATSLDDLCAEALAAYRQAHPEGKEPPCGVHAAEDFTVIDSKREQFVVAPNKDRIFASESAAQEATDSQ